MNDKEPKGIIELGDIYIKCLIFETNNNNLEILSTSITPSEGIHNDVIVNLVKASKAIRSCIGTAEKKAKISLKKINVVFEQPDFLCTKFSKQKRIDGSKIYKDDIEFLLKDAKKQLIHNDKNQSIIHIFNHNYIVDGKIFVEEPIGVYANLLTHEMTFITTLKNNLRNINQAFIDCDIEIERLFSRIFALGVELFNNNSLDHGSVLIDLGFEKTSIGLFKNLALVHSTTFPFGTNHITKDISKVCSLSLDEANNIMNNIDFSLKNNQDIFDKNNYLKDNYFINSNFRKISKQLILDIIKARLNEITDKLKEQLNIPGFDSNSGINYLLVVENLNLLNIESYFIDFFEPSIKKNHNDVMQDQDKDLKKFASCKGALKIITDGWETEAIPKISDRNIGKIGLLAKIFGNQ